MTTLPPYWLHTLHGSSVVGAPHPHHPTVGTPGVGCVTDRRVPHPTPRVFIVQRVATTLIFGLGLSHHSAPKGLTGVGGPRTSVELPGEEEGTEDFLVR